MKNITLEDYLHATDDKIRDTQAEIDDLEMFGGTPEQESQLRIQLAELQDKKARIARSIEQARKGSGITLEKGNAIQPSRIGGWGRLHYVSRAMGPRDLERDFWICSGCQREIQKGQEHYRRNYYNDKADNRSGEQIRLCMHCYDEHALLHPCNTTFPVYRPAQRKPEIRKAA